MRRKIQTSLEELADAVQMNNDAVEHYLDVNTGEIIMRMDPVISGFRDEEFEEELEEEFGERYLRMPRLESREAYQVMVAFTETLTSTPLRNRLERALNGRKPFRAFKDVLYDFPEERDEWFAFEREAHRLEVLRWLEANELTLDSDP